MPSKALSYLIILYIQPNSLHSVKNNISSIPEDRNNQQKPKGGGRGDRYKTDPKIIKILKLSNVDVKITAISMLKKGG